MNAICGEYFGNFNSASQGMHFRVYENIFSVTFYSAKNPQQREDISDLHFLSYVKYSQTKSRTLCWHRFGRSLSERDYLMCSFVDVLWGTAVGSWVHGTEFWVKHSSSLEKLQLYSYNHTFCGDYYTVYDLFWSYRFTETILFRGEMLQSAFLTAKNVILWAKQ